MALSAAPATPWVGAPRTAGLPEAELAGAQVTFRCRWRILNQHVKSDVGAGKIVGPGTHHAFTGVSGSPASRHEYTVTLDLRYYGNYFSFS